MRNNTLDCRAVLRKDHPLQPEILNHILDTLDADKRFRSEAFASEDFPKARKPYEREGFLKGVAREQVGSFIQLFRDHAVPYDILMETVKGYGTRFLIQLQQTPAEALQHVDELAQHLAGLIRPGYDGVLHDWNEDSDEAEAFSDAVIANPNLFRHNGLDRLGVRSRLGPHITVRLRAPGTVDVPDAVIKDAWGGGQIGLRPEPWSTSFADLYAAQEHVMGILDQSGVFGQYDQFPMVKRGRNWRPYLDAHDSTPST
ncbi:hypothetical protein [Deinococcus maricopensis]|uniref:Uncharacterized protein n=1 Tax=Deinococcus maricopensis (strain DSM 21211 / LMG 22137 / NRRL B-23946 / LB-34) TaxID=709986 RepID=E8U5F5_DEIML|nr:hypothetical protein [Deinococcus maricopensis]ADV66294.1 hypothetical protein Deima_0637 [Deinococcus maricopensis DSM 21211]